MACASAAACVVILYFFGEELLEWTQFSRIPSHAVLRRRVSAHPYKSHRSSGPQTGDRNIDDPINAIIPEVDAIERLIEADPPPGRSRRMQFDLEGTWDRLGEPGLGIIRRDVQSSLE